MTSDTDRPDESTQQPEPNQPNTAFATNYALGVALGIPLGTLFGLLVLDNIALGMVFGIVFAPVIGLILNQINPGQRRQAESTNVHGESADHQA